MRPQEPCSCTSPAECGLCCCHPQGRPLWHAVLTSLYLPPIFLPPVRIFELSKPPAFPAGYAPPPPTEGSGRGKGRGGENRRDGGAPRRAA